MMERKVITPILSSEWFSYIVPVIKHNGSIRLYGSYIALNRNLEDVYYPMPRIEQIFAVLAGNVQYSKLDLKSAYRQFELDEDSERFVAISTHKGLYAMNRLPFGLKCASFYCQKYIEQLFQRCENVFIFQDDILIGRKVIKILEEAG